MPLETPKKVVPPKKIEPRKPSRSPNPGQDSGVWIFWVLLFIIFIIISNPANTTNTAAQKMSYGDFYALVKDNDSTGKIKKLTLSEGPETILKGKLSDGKEFRVNIPNDDKDILKLVRENVKDFSVVPAETFWTQFFFSFVPVILIIFFIWFLGRRGAEMGNKIWSFGKSRAKVSDKGQNKITFIDVAGVDEAKEELQEIIEFLKDPKKFERLGGKIPRGVLLVGPPGTGKTLLAKAVAGEADVPFFSLSGSDFVEMFVGVGASRVRDLFEQARKAAKAAGGKGCIIFIDEIDAVGRQRFAGIGGGNDEREQTLNALLVEMDGFNSPSGFILMAATNRPDTLDPALLRPGRFDRRVMVGLPDINGREGILKVHCRNIKLDKDVDLRKVSQQTVYFSGADLANVCNEAALLAARRNRETVGMLEFLNAVERVTLGPEKKSHITSKREKEMTAHHEAGHALLSLLIDEVDTFTKVSIIPRGMAGGYTLTPPTEDKHYYTRKELFGQMTVLLGGLVGEEVFMDDTTTGVSNDLERVRELAHSMICAFGMSDQMGKMAFGKGHQPSFLGRDLFQEKDYSEETARRIDEEVHKLVDSAYLRAKQIITSNREKLELIANRLIEKEVIDIDEARVLLGVSLPTTISEGAPQA
ncbi:MAG: ATP-dependent zinc metalloprotease FtsH [Candidatus Omnitrophica bacterium]|nr:ATP-dependent zinc metalloprotease FtsH [Candidatus Omnitrophota bacterium]